MYKAGELLKCEVKDKSANDYTITIEGGGTGRLITQNNLEIGSTVDAYFVCMHRDQVIAQQVSNVAFIKITEQLALQDLENKQKLSVTEGQPLPQRLIQLLYATGFIDHKVVEELTNLQGQAESEMIEATLLKLKHIGSVTSVQLLALSEGLHLVTSGAITFEKLAVAFYDQVYSSVPLIESLKVRGWLTPQSA